MKNKIFNNLEKKFPKSFSESYQTASNISKNLKKDTDTLIDRFITEFEKNNRNFNMITDLKEEFYLLSNYNAFGSDDIN